MPNFLNDDHPFDLSISGSEDDLRYNAFGPLTYLRLLTESLLMSCAWDFLLLISLLLPIAVPKTAAAQEVQELVELLDSDERVKRILAERELIRRGENVLEELQTVALKHPASEFHLERIASAIRSQVVQSALAGTKVTLPTDSQLSLGQATELIDQQTLFLVSCAPPLFPLKWNADLRDVPFWKALDELGQAADVGWERREHELLFTPDAMLKNGAPTYVDCFRIAAVHRLQKQSFRRRSARALTRVSLRVDVEPTVTPYWLTLRDRDFQLNCDKMQPDSAISVFNPDAVREVSTVAGPWFEFSVDFTDSELPADQALNLRGTIEVFCAARTTAMELPLVTKDSANLRVKLVSSSQEGQELRIIVDVIMPQGVEKFDSHRLTLLHRDAELNLGSGVKRSPAHQQIIEMEDFRHRVEYMFRVTDPISMETQFTYRYPDYFTSRSLTFEIQGIQVSH